ncbi:NCS2 family permease [Anaerorhabdus furcosa]|uniref:Putative MFS transporter, AGZA family, xanthine/uracil permease n=1 Tax=Anaerorhabdus furcosa TaxID=118967 RepID=A0A1T4L4U3_9FIRM|nr:NCS2 family permease [Anaerorhabdus furcosa]SJZ49724.1 putative MFS transporter, AGZA family, xanthine/uracil permease [Anaerorhabdus furcosa]
MLEKLFKLQEKKTNVKTEIIAGTTTFLAMAYILFVNPDILSATGMSFQSVFLATAISAGIASIIMGIVANYPVALAPGMGVNALFAFTVCGPIGVMGLSWQAGLAAVFVSGIIFLLISVTGIRKVIINSIPKNMKLAIGAGIGFFIAFIGFKNAGIIVASEATFVALGNLKEPTVLLAVFGLLLTILLLTKKVNAAVFWGLLGTAIVGVVMSLCGLGVGLPTLPTSVISFDFEMPTFMAFTSGFKELFSSPAAIVIIFSFLFVDFFDTAGTLVAVGNDIGLVNEEGEMENIEKALLSDSVGTIVGSMMGTSTVTSFVESGSGVAAGGRTGLTACVTGLLFFLSVFFSPLLSVVTSAVTAPALITVGILMVQQVRDIEWSDVSVAASAFVTIIMMLLCYSISDGIAFGFIVYTLANIGAGKTKDIKTIVWILDIIFIIYFISK